MKEANDAQSSGADEVDIRHDDEGVPTRIEIDYEINAIDDEACYYIRGFRPVRARSDRAVRDGSVYASVINQLVFEDYRLGRGRSPYKVVYVIDGALPAAGRPRGDLLTRPPKPFSGLLIETIREGLGADLPPVRFIDRAQVALQKGPNMDATNNGVIVALGPIKDRDDGVQVANTLWCGGKCSRWQTYVLSEENERWLIIGTAGPVVGS